MPETQQAFDGVSRFTSLTAQVFEPEMLGFRATANQGSR